MELVHYASYKFYLKLIEVLKYRIIQDVPELVSQIVRRDTTSKNMKKKLV